ncbi:hypothetical protein [Candidatus Methanoprimaticola sp. MG2]|uniref:hypothetical protein n=1 Tax=Candidatus Methanoprimaticola sp. MG2 TaxID=3228838 RepID=UPI0039C6452F
MIGRMGTTADVVFGPHAMASIFDAVERSCMSGGLTGSIEADDKGRFCVVTGAGTNQVGMFFPSEGTEATKEMIDEFKRHSESGVLIVIDPEISELAIYSVKGGDATFASALMSE